MFYWKETNKFNDFLFSENGIEVKVPGYNKENLTVYYEKNIAFILFDLKKEERLMKIPISNIKLNSIKAKIKDGILKISYEKKEDEPDIYKIDLEG